MEPGQRPVLAAGPSAEADKCCCRLASTTDEIAVMPSKMDRPLTEQSWEVVRTVGRKLISLLTMILVISL